MSKLINLKHVTKKLPHGGEVIVLDTGAVIGPEAEAMIQALHSRSTGGMKVHLRKLDERGPEKFMSTHYVGYGDKSIGDCGTATVFIEGVSMLVAKAVQDWPLYSGQESSTRYLDFSVQKFVDPVGTAESNSMLEGWRSFYLRGLGVLIPYLKEKFPRVDTEKEAIYDKAIRARAFDIMRGFLPAGASTNLAWHSNLRQIADKLLIIRHHPLEEVRNTALTIEGAMLEAYPSSFSQKRYEATETYNEICGENLTYFHADTWPDFEISMENVDHDLLKEYRKVLANRPSKTELPKQIAECGVVQFSFLLDFGSFRDIQRHRAVTQRMPLLTTKHGFADWYLSELPSGFRNEAQQFLREQEQKIACLKCSQEIAQYYIAMGYNLPNRLTGNLHALVYLVELRATRFVHPTLRRRAKQMAEELELWFGDDGLVLHLDKEPDRFDVRRGEHDITELKG